MLATSLLSSMNSIAIAMLSKPKGIFTRKIQRQLVQVTIAPPSSGPSMRPITGGTVNQTIAAISCVAGTLRSRISRPTGSIIAPPRPCRIRYSTSEASESAMPHNAEPSENIAIAVQNTRLAPNRSATQPLSGRNTARLKR